MHQMGQIYQSRWREPDHDGLTVANLEGARRLGWLTQVEIDDMTGDDDG